MKMPLPRCSFVAAAALLALTAGPAHALFKVVGPDGKVTYTDRPPPAAQGRATTVSTDGSSASADASLPLALRTVAARFPVTLFTSNDCGDPCVQGRGLLAKRGVPYVERVAENADDRDAWATLVGGIESPTLRVGAESVRGFVPGAWDQLLSTAGYPLQSLLPPNYRQPPATPLTARKQAPPPPVATTPAPAPVDRSSNPGGVRF